MKLVKGQRWKCKNPVCVVEIIEPTEGYSSKSMNAMILIVQSTNSTYKTGTKNTFCGFPAIEDGDNNDLWEYLHGQDKPCDANL
jgi:hypothetical protein